MREEIRAKIHELLDACIDSETDVWFEYIPHIRAVAVHRDNTKHHNKHSYSVDLAYLYHHEKLKAPIERYDEVIERIKGYDE